MKKLLLSLLFFSLVSCGTSENLQTSSFTVKEGDSINRVITRLNNEEIISEKIQFRILAKITGKESKLKIGTYNIPPKVSYNKLLNILISGKGIGVLVTIPEGFNIFQIAGLLEDNDIVSAQEFLNEVYDNAWLKEFNIPTNNNTPITRIKYFSDQNDYKFAVPSTPKSYSLEGYLFPDTYSFDKNSSAKIVVQAMVDRFHAVVDNSILAQIKEQNKTLNEVIILASIIQKEATGIKEMPKVSGVYNNRLDKNMILQADPTLIYALILDGEYNGNIRTRHLKPPWPSPYNTYFTTTLPIGAIANPGKDAILATLNPAKHDFIYFVGSPDGEHTYSLTYKEHEKAVQKWVKHRRGK